MEVMILNFLIQKMKLIIKVILFKKLKFKINIPVLLYF